MCAYLLQVPDVYGVWNACKVVVTQIFQVFLPIVTYDQKACYAPVQPQIHTHN